MRWFSKHYKRQRVAILKVALVVIFLNIIFVPQFVKYTSEGENLFTVYLNGEEVGIVGKEVDVEKLLCDARRTVAQDNDGLILAEAELKVEGQEVVYAELDNVKEVEAKMVDMLNKSIYDTLQHAYTLKIGNNTFNLKGSEEVRQVLQAAIDKYDEKGEYEVVLDKDANRELNALTARVVKKEEAAEEIVEAKTESGIADFFKGLFEKLEAEADKDDFDSYEYGLVSIEFGNSIEIVDAYLMPSQLTSAQEAIDIITATEEKNEIYEVKSGDTLSGISLSTNIPIEKLISLNPSLESENSTIRIGQELIITNPEPPLSIERTEQEYIEETYDEEVQYVDNDEWYTNQQVTLQEPSAGRRNIVAMISYHNDKEVGKEVLKEELVLAAVPKIVEKGTKIPPTYIKPISGGRMSSGFGPRKRPTKGASTYHKGIDWAVAKGTTVVASSGGVVTKAGWGSGYGNVVYIQHPDGKETRYGHLSKCLVRAGQTVKQGDKIALSGNSGVSSGPHVHFEIRVGGTAVNPLKYLN